MNSAACPLCNRNNPSTIGTISFAEVAAGYAQPWLNVDISPLLGARGVDGKILLLRCEHCDLRWYGNAPAGDGAFYERLQEHDWYYQTAKPEYAFAATHVPKDAKVLEVGCGSGAFSNYLPRSASYRGLEFNDAAVMKSTSAGLDVRKLSLAQEAATNPASYDVVCHFQVLEHVTDPSAFLRDSVAALKPGGSLIFAVPSEDSFLGLAESNWLNMPPHHLTRWSDTCLRHTIATLNLKLAALWHEPVAEYHQVWHAQVLLTASLRALISATPQLKSSTAIRRASRVAQLFPRGVRAWLRRRALHQWPSAAQGHSVCVVATKP